MLFDTVLFNVVLEHAIETETNRPVLEQLFSELSAEENRHINALERQLADVRT
ncbi:MAG: hypothetical protein ACLFRY_12775 [Spirochaetia bacterium]